MKKIFLLCVLLLFIKQTAAAAGYDGCTRLLNDQKYKNAVKCYSSFFSKYRMNPHYRLVYGVALCKARLYSAAFENFNYVIKRLPPGGYADYALQYKKYCAAKRNQERIMAASDKDEEYLADLNSIAVWRKRPVNYWIQDSIYYELTKEAFREWERETAYAIKFRKVNRPEYADIKVYFVNILPCNILGVTQNKTAYVGGKRVIQSSVIKILSKTPSGTNRNRLQVYPVLLHEIAHAIGLEGHSKSKQDILYHNTDYYNQSLSDRDIESIRKIYKR